MVISNATIVIGFGLVTMHVLNPGELAKELISLLFASLLMFGVTSILIESSNNIPMNYEDRCLFGMAFASSYYSNITVNKRGRAERTSVRSFFEGHFGACDRALPYTLAPLPLTYSPSRPAADPVVHLLTNDVGGSAWLKFENVVGRDNKRQSVAHGGEGAERVAAEAMKRADDARADLNPRPNLVGTLVSAAIVSVLVAASVNRASGTTDYVCLAVVSVLIVAIYPIAIGILFQWSPKRLKACANRAKQLVELVTPPNNAFRSRVSENYLSFHEPANVRALYKTKSMIDHVVKYTETLASIVNTFSMLLCILSLVVAVVLTYTSESIPGVALVCLLYTAFGFCNLLPTLQIGIEHNETYNKKLPLRLQERVVTLTNTLASPKIDAATREKYRVSCMLLQAMHDEIIAHPNNIEIFGVPVTKALYGRFIALAFSLTFSILVRLISEGRGGDGDEF